MINFKWGFFAAVIAFFFSFGIGLIFKVGFSHIILRAVIFAVVFFGVGFGLRFTINNFFPEILTVNDGYESAETHKQQTGQHINITLDTTGEYAVPELFKKTGVSDEIGNIDDLVSGFFKPRREGVDRFNEESYNQNNDEYSGKESYSEMPVTDELVFTKFEKPQSAKPVVIRQDFNPSFGDSSNGLGGLPDLDTMAMAFSSVGEHSSDVFSMGDFGGDIFESGMTEDNSPRHLGNKPQPLKGDFNPKELAQGIRTVLSKEK
jgi:hypothetical protein